MPTESFIARMHSEAGIDGFSQHDGTIRFYAFVWACILRTGGAHVLDYGAGRGAFFYRNTTRSGSLYRKHLQDLRNTGARITACDIDPLVFEHPCSHEQAQINAGEPLPFENDSFDVIVCDHVFEHIEDPSVTASELVRILRPGGYICVRTPNRYGYVAVASSLVPNRLHRAVLGYAMPDRKAEDTFPTLYRMNTPAQIRRCFSGSTVYHYSFSGEPAYAFKIAFIYRAFQLLHWLLPGPLKPILCAFIQKPRRAAD